MGDKETTVGEFGKTVPSRARQTWKDGDPEDLQERWWGSGSLGGGDSL